VERSDSIAESTDDGSAIASTRYPTSARLLAAIHRGEERAISELFILYAPLLRDQARRMSIHPDERHELVTTLLDDVVLHLMETRIAPRQLTRYLVAALRNRARNHLRDAQRQQAIRDGAYTEINASRERIVAECHSEYGLRTSGAANVADSHPLASAISKLARKSAGELTRDELAMIIGVGHHVPLRDVAEHLGIAYGTARVRLHRLRERFVKLAIQYVSTLEADEKREIERFFRRAGVSLAENAENKTERRAIERGQRSQREKTNGQT
jgi:RNA polymerase sigma factor (sigma-70 family)